MQEAKNLSTKSEADLAAVLGNFRFTKPDANSKIGKEKSNAEEVVSEENVGLDIDDASDSSVLNRKRSEKKKSKKKKLVLSE